MAAPVYSTRLVSASNQGAGSLATFNSPAGFVTVIRNFDCVLITPATPDSLIEVLGDLGQAVWAVQTTQTTRNSFSFEGRIVLESGEAYSVYVARGNWHYQMSGYRLSQL